MVEESTSDSSVPRADVSVERHEVGEASTSSFFFKSLRSVSEGGKLEGIRVPCGNGEAGAYDGDEANLPGSARTIALCPSRDILFALSPDGGGFWVYSIATFLEAYQRKDIKDLGEEGFKEGQHKALGQEKGRAIALELNSDESLLCAVCTNEVSFFDTESTLGAEAGKLKASALFKEDAKFRFFRWSSLAGSSSFLAVSQDGDLKVVGPERTFSAVGKSITCAAWSPDDAYVAYGSMKVLTVMLADYKQAFDVELLHSEYTMKLNSIVWLSTDTLLVMCMNEGNEDAEEEELAFCYTVKLNVSEGSNQVSKADVTKIDEDAVCIALDEEGAPLGSGPYLHHVSASDWNATIIAHRKSVGDCSINIIAADEIYYGSYNAAEVLQDGFDDADSLRPAIPLRTDIEDSDDYIVGLQVYPCANNIKVKDPMKEAYTELDKSFPIVFISTLSSRIFLFSFAGMSENLPLESKQTTRISRETLDLFCKRLDSIQVGVSLESTASLESKEAAIQQSLPDGDSDEDSEEETTDTRKEAAIQQSLPDGDSDEDSEEETADTRKEAAIQQSLPDGDSDEDSEEETADTRKEAAIQQSLPDGDSDEDSEEETADTRKEAAIQQSLPDDDSDEDSEEGDGSSLQKSVVTPTAAFGTQPNFNFKVTQPFLSSATQKGNTAAPAFGSFGKISTSQSQSIGNLAKKEDFGVVPKIKAMNFSSFSSTETLQTQSTSSSTLKQAEKPTVFGSLREDITSSKPKNGMPLQTLQKVKKVPLKRVQVSSDLLNDLQDSFLETIIETRQMQEKLASTISGEDCNSLRSLSERMKKSMAISQNTSKTKMDLEDSRGALESLLQKLKTLEKQAQSYSNPNMGEDSFHSINSASIESKKRDMHNSLSSLQETVNDVTEFLNKYDLNKYRIPLNSPGASRQKSIHGIYSTINAQSTLAKNQKLQLEDLQKKMEQLQREKTSQNFLKLSLRGRDMGSPGLKGNLDELMLLEDEGDLQPSSPWQVKEKDYISTTIIEAIRKASKSKGPRVTKVETFNKDQHSREKGEPSVSPKRSENVTPKFTMPTASAESASGFSLSVKPMQPISNGKSSVKQPAFSQFQSPVESNISTFGGVKSKMSAKSSGGAPMPPMPSFGQVKAASNTMNTFLKKEETPKKAAAAPAATPKSSGGAPMPPMPSFGQVKAASNTMSTFLEKEETPKKEAAAPAATPKSSGGAPMPPMPSFGQVKAASNTMNTFLKKEETPKKAAAAPAATPKSSGGAPMPPMPSFGQVKAASNTMSTFLEKEETPKKEAAAPAATPKSSGGAPMPPMPSFGQVKAASNTMNTFLKKEETPKKEAAAPAATPKSSGGAPMPPMPSFGQMKAAKDTMSTFLKKEETPKKEAAAPAVTPKSSGGAPMPPMPSFGQVKAASNTMNTFLKKEETPKKAASGNPAAKSSTPEPKTGSISPMPPMPSFGQIKEAKEAMNTFLKKEDTPKKEAAAAAVTPKSSGGAPMPPMPSFGQMKAAKDTMSTFLKKEETPKKEAAAPAATPKSSGGAPMPPMPSFGQMKAAKDTMSTFLKKEETPKKEAAAPAVTPKSSGGAPMPPMPSFGQMKAAKDTMSTFLKKEETPKKEEVQTVNSGGTSQSKDQSSGFQSSANDNKPVSSSSSAGGVFGFGAQLNALQAGGSTIAGKTEETSSSQAKSTFGSSQSVGMPFGSSAFGQPQAIGSSAASSSAFSNVGMNRSQSTFGNLGQSSGFGNASGVSSFGSSTPAFGSSASFGQSATISAFGQPATFGQASSFGGFGKPSTIGGSPVQTPTSVSQSPFGQAAQAAASVSSFGKPTTAFGQPSSIAQFGKPAVAFGMQTPSSTSGFGQATASVGQSPFASFGQTAQPGAFGQPPANQGSPFGVSSTPFGQTQQQPGSGGGGGGGFGAFGSGNQMTSPTGFSNKMKSNPSAWQPRR